MCIHTFLKDICAKVNVANSTGMKNNIIHLKQDACVSENFELRVTFYHAQLNILHLTILIVYQISVQHHLLFLKIIKNQSQGMQDQNHF